MKVSVQLNGLPTLYDALRKNKRVEVEFPGKTSGELIDAMARKFGVSIKKALLDKNGDLDMEIRVLLNGATYLDGNRIQASLNDGDTLIFQAPS